MASQKSLEFFRLQWHITEYCNLLCRHCYQSETATVEMSWEQKRKALKHYLDFVLKLGFGADIVLTGGEPILHKDFFRLLDEMRGYYQDGLPLCVSIMTNGTTIDQQSIQRLKEYGRMVGGFQVSLDGASEETNDLIRGHGVFRKAKQALEMLKGAGYVTALHFVIHELNKDEALEVAKLGTEIGVDRVTISRHVPIGRGQDSPRILTPTELKDIWRKLSRYADELAGRGAQTRIVRERCDLWHLVDPKRAVELIYDWSPHSLGARCPVGISGLVLMPDGTVLGCRRLDIPLGNIMEHTLFQIWYGSEFLWMLRNRHKFQQGKCQHCKFLLDPMLRILCCGGAPCISHAVYNDCFLPDPQCWYTPTREGENLYALHRKDSSP